MPLPLRWFVLIVLILGLPAGLTYLFLNAIIPGQVLIVGSVLSALYLTATLIVATQLPDLYLKHYNARKLTGNQWQNQMREYVKQAGKAGIQNPPIYVINDAAPHAFGVGLLSSQRKIFVTKGLLDTLEPDQLVAYLEAPIVMMARGETMCMTLGCAAAYVVLLPMKIADAMDSEGVRVIIALTFGLVAALYLQAIGLRRYWLTIDQAAARNHGHGGHLSFGSALNHGSKHLHRHPLVGLDFSSAPLFVVNPFGKSAISAIFATHAPTPKRVKRLQRLGSRIVGKEAVAKSKGLV